VRLSSPPWRLYDTSGEEKRPDGRPLRRALRGERVDGDEYRIETDNAGDRWLWTAAVPLHDETGRIASAVRVQRDISEERKRREQVLQGEKLRALGQLASGVAHDLNQSLGMISGYSDLAEQALSALTPTRPRRETVLRSSQELPSTAARRLPGSLRSLADGPREVIRPSTSLCFSRKC
jgi:two-component system cell cycle sensor histidine kinase/response regulator CckA